MYQCEDCHRTFFEPQITTEIHYECDGHPYETFLECPYCGGGFKETTNDITEQE